MKTIHEHYRMLLFVLCMLIGFSFFAFLPITKLDTIPFSGSTKILPQKQILTYKAMPSYRPETYLICSIDDDPEGYNSHGVYHPVDLAVTILSLRKLGTEHLFLGTHLHWPELDPEDNATLNTTISGLKSCIVSVPLKRTASTLNIPDYLLQHSIPLSSVEGDTSKLPEVNNLSLAPTFIIPENTQVGFSQLETEPDSNNIPLLAKWGDRVILSSLLLERLKHLEVPSSKITIKLGEQIIMGSSGSLIPIDPYGYFTPTSSPKERSPDVISSQITAIEQSPIQTPNTILTAAGIQADSYRAINQPVAQLDKLTLTPVVGKDSVSQPTNLGTQLIAIISVILAVSLTTHLKTRKYLLLLTILSIAATAIAALIAISSDSYILITPLFAIIGTAFIYRLLIRPQAPLDSQE